MSNETPKEQPKSTEAPAETTPQPAVYEHAAEFTDEESDQIGNFPAAITDEEMESMEEAASTKARGVQRRLCLLACARSAEALSKLSVEEPDAFSEMLEAIEAFKEHTQGLSEIAEISLQRMLIAGRVGSQ